MKVFLVYDTYSATIIGVYIANDDVSLPNACKEASKNGMEIIEHSAHTAVSDAAMVDEIIALHEDWEV